MKRFLLLWVLLISAYGKAQNSEKEIYSFQEVEIKPIFPGGMQFFNQFLADNFVVPKSEEFKGGKMLVDFVIDTTGTITDVRILRDIGFNISDQAKFILSQSEKWIPGRQNDQKVKVRYAMPITITAPNPEDIKIYEAKELDKMPEYPGGMNEFYKLFMKNYKTPNVPDIKGKVFASFVVETDGSLSEKRIIRDIGYGTGAEMMRVLGLSELWTPGEKDGKPVRVMYSLPINIEGPGQ